MELASESRTCEHCGRTESDAAVLLTWSSAVERGGLRWFCLECSRRHLRSMEGKLDSAWW